MFLLGGIIRRSVRHRKHFFCDLTLDGFIRCQGALEIGLDRSILEGLFDHGFLGHFLIVGFPGGIAGIKRLGISLGKGVHIQFGHDREAIASIDSAEQPIEVSYFAAVSIGGAMDELGLKAVFLFKGIVLIDGLCLDGLHLAIAVGKIDQSFVADLELTFEGALILIRNQVCLSQGCVRF